MIMYTDYECRLKLTELLSGYSVVIPKSINHAESMIRVAQFYIDQQHRQTINLLKEEHKC